MSLPTTQGNPVYDALVAAAMRADPNEQWTTQYRDPLSGEIANNAIARWGSDRVLDTIRDMPGYALAIARSTLGIGPPVYNRTGAGDEARQVYVPWSGWHMQGPGSIYGVGPEAGNAGNSPYGRYDDHGRFIGLLSGLLGDRYVY